MRSYATFLISLFLLLLLLLLQNVQVFIMCYQLEMTAGNSLHRAAGSTALEPLPMPKTQHIHIYPIDNNNNYYNKNNKSNKNSNLINKRTIIDGFGQTEEVLPQQTVDQIESNYDEYPMVVPKRSDLMLDRLMFALHRAIEKERESSLNDFYLRAKEHNALQDHDQDSESDINYNMYSDDDPSVMMDYDFKDLNSINRATGESLMPKKFQRRTLGVKMGGGGDRNNDDENINVKNNNIKGIDNDDNDEDGGYGRGGDRGHRAGGNRFDGNSRNGNNIRAQPVLSALVSSTNDNLNGLRNTVGNNGRMYWRCYFNAVSCF